MSDLLSAQNRPHAVARLNEEVSAIEQALSRAQDLPSVAARVALASGTLLAVIALAQDLTDPERAHTLWMVPVVIGFCTALWVRQIDRLADARARRVRSEWDVWLHDLEPLLGPPEASNPLRADPASEVDPLASSG